MNTMSALLARLEPEGDEESPRASMLVSMHQPPSPQVQAIVHWFKQDADRQRLRIVLDGEAAGILQRHQIQATQGSTRRGFGDSAGYSLPGTARLDAIVLVCSRPDCQENIWATWYDPMDPPRCPLHPDSPCMEAK